MWCVCALWLPGCRVASCCAWLWSPDGQTSTSRGGWLVWPWFCLANLACPNLALKFYTRIGRSGYTSLRPLIKLRSPVWLLEVSRVQKWLCLIYSIEATDLRCLILLSRASVHVFRRRELCYGWIQRIDSCH